MSEAEPEGSSTVEKTPPVFVESVGFVLSQLGFAVSYRFKQTLAAFDLDPRQFALLHHIRLAQGQPQQALGESLRIPPSSMVSLVDHLEARHLIERQPDPSDRRIKAIYLTAAGNTFLDKTTEIVASYEKDLCAGLAPGERDLLLGLLRTVASNLGLTPGLHPGLGADHTSSPWPEGESPSLCGP
jgi:DNA-binding MarR family transcriptional regulator